MLILAKPPTQTKKKHQKRHNERTQNNKNDQTNEDRTNETTTEKKQQRQKQNPAGGIKLNHALEGHMVPTALLDGFVKEAKCQNAKKMKNLSVPRIR